MRMQFRPLYYSIALLMFLFSSSIFAHNWELVDITIPPNDEVFGTEDTPPLPKYTNPTKDFTNKLTDWSDDCVIHAAYLDTQMQFLVLKRNAAKTAAYGGWNWSSRIRQIAVDAASKSYYSMLNSFITDLENMGDKIDREQAYAAACKEVNHLYPTLQQAMQMMDSMHAVAVEVRGNYAGKPGQSLSGLHSLLPKIKVSLPTIVNPEWLCMGNNAIQRSDERLYTCHETYDTPYKAKNDHRLWCGGYKDPNPDVAGCGLSYYNCVEFYVEFHQVLYCHRSIVWSPPGSWRGTKVGICGEAFRKCPGSLSRAGVHDYRPVSSWNNGGSYWSGYEAHPYHDLGVGTYTETIHIGSKTPPVASSGKPVVHGSNGVGVDSVIPDESSDCDTCIDASKHCPGCGSDDDQASASPGLSPVGTSTITINGEEMVDAAPGETISVNLVMPSAKGYSQIYWYLADPGVSGLGNQVGNPTTPSGSGVETEVSSSFTLPSDASGVYKFTAYIYPHSSASDQKVYEYSFKIYVS